MLVVISGPQTTEELHQTGKLLLGASAPCWTGDASPVAPLSLAPIVAEHADLDQGDRFGERSLRKEGRDHFLFVDIFLGSC